MADPKYADLPGIAYDQPDIYETDDLPEADQNADFYEEESESIERLHISANEAFTKFRGKSLNAGKVDFSDRISKQRHSGYDVWNWELVGKGENETPFQKYQRLQLEIKELVEEVTQMKEIENSTEEGVPEYKQFANQVEEAVQQMAEVRLEEVMGSQLAINLLDPEGTTASKLIAELETLKQAENTQRPSTEKTPSSQEESLFYELQFQPQKAGLSRTSRLAQLEQRLRQVENALGATSQRMAMLCVDPKNKGQSCSLMQAVQVLSAKVNLLDSSHLDHVEGRLIALSQKMDSIAEKNASKTQDIERDRKVAELYDLVKKNSEEVAQILPQTFDRMCALEALHKQAIGFGKSLSQLEAIQQQISASLHGSEELLKNDQSNFSQQLESIKKKIVNLDDRIAALTKK